MQAEGNENIAKAYGRGAKQVRQHSMRIYNKDRLLKVNGFGPATTNVSRPALAMHSPKAQTRYTSDALALCAAYKPQGTNGQDPLKLVLPQATGLCRPWRGICGPTRSAGQGRPTKRSWMASSATMTQSAARSSPKRLVPP